MEIALGALVALAYGSGDFLGGISTKRLPTLTVLLVSQSFGLAAAVVLVVALVTRHLPRTSFFCRRRRASSSSSLSDCCSVASRWAA